MAPKQRFTKIATAVLAELSDQLQKILQKGSLVDMYYNLQKRLEDMQQDAYELGLKEGKREIMDKIHEFDASKDDTSN